MTRLMKKKKDSKKENLLDQEKIVNEVQRPLPSENEKVYDDIAITNYLEIETETKERYKDAFFACMFLSHIVAMVIIGIVYGRSPYDDEEKKLALKANFQSISSTVVLFFLFSTFLTIHALMLMVKIPMTVIRLSMVFNISASIGITTIGVMQKNVLVEIFGFGASCWSIMFIVLSWGKLSFIAENLKTALLGISYHVGLFGVAFGHLFLLLIWIVWWVYTTVGIINASTLNYCDDWECEQFRDWASITILVVSFIWTFQVIKNTLHVTVASTIGKWWHSTEKPYKSGSNVRSSFVLAVTKSMGSICVGSLLMAVAQALQKFSRHMKSKKERSALSCCTDCMLEFFQGIIEYFNEWAYVFVGLHGYGYLESGKRVRDLFQERGWTTLLTDNVIGNVLCAVSVVVSLLSGLVGLIANSAFNLQGKESPTEVFLIGIITGFVASRVFMTVLASAVNAIIVCYAEAPENFEQNYPEESLNMNEAWEEFCPATEDQYEV